ncbi:SPOR domain-containing protein [Rhizobium sp. 3T7]|uniref:SPOR domain-containing protein n=1 Tax=Rhizobium sp. 3T7 TaxID=2874922 RepID=UPI001CCEC277|nr:SPOR domain-containing protein [Rhizobium sp. 3T7]MBZ9790560.1 SPOR domain-containing protein [Rhizobium sp. 3T7]
MADKQRAYDTRKNTDLFADDDPLAELARIVGFEPRVAANTVEDAPRQEPAFNLEDELLREFERYDEPQSAASFDRLPEPVLEQPAAYEAPIEADTLPAGEAEAEFVPEFVTEPEVVSEPMGRQPFDVASNLTSAAWASSAVREGEPVAGGARDLIEELEMSIGATPAPAAPVAPAKAPQWSAASIRLPIANFHPARRDEASSAPIVPVAAPAPEPAVVASESVAAFDVPVAAGFPAEIDRHEEPETVPDASEMRQEAPVVEALIDHSAFDLAAAAKDDGAVQADAALTEAAPTEVDDIAFDIDELLADVSHYPVPERQIMAAADVAEMPRSPETVRVAAPVVAPLPKPVEPPVSVPTAKAEPEGDDPFAGHDFELDLEGIELELADFDFAEPVKVQPQAVESQRVQAQHVEAVRPQPVAPVPAFQPPPAPAPVVVAAPISRIPVEVPPVAKAPASPAFSADAGDDLPFDPSMISDAEYHPEAVEEMHVPVLPPVEQPEPVVATSDFDFDVDAEIANLLAPAKPAETPAKPAVEEWRTRAPISVAPTAAPVAKQVPLQSLDEFERALEEDFRRSVNEPVQRRENVSQVQIQSASEAEDMSRARSMKRMLAAAAAIVVFGGVAYAGYTFLARDGGLGIASGEPRVITADKDPVKVVPENPGGKTVPNQDKAVYDSVGGAAAEAPKQKALVSSDEQPVDVVQRTLTPETLPEDNDSDIAPPMATPVGDTQDPRLLPSQDTAVADEGDNGNQAPSVSARKVRTMIVRPDGTLVARDEPSPEAASTLPKATTVQTQKITAGSKPAGGTAANFPASGQVATADIRSTPVEETKPTAAQAPSENALAKAAAATPANVDPPVRAVKSSTVSDTAPAPVGRPPVTDAAKAPEAPTAPAAQKPKDVAAVSPAATQAQPTAAAGGYGVQIASLPSEEEAKKSYASLSKKFASVLSGRSYEIRKAEIAGKGTFYRVRIPASSKDEAAAICEKYRAAGGSCLISK